MADHERSSGESRRQRKRGKKEAEELENYDDYSVDAHLQGNLNDIGPHGKVLPPELSRTVVKLSCQSSADGGVCDVYLVGTSHTSEKSCQEVKDIINFLTPQVVFLELCESRVAKLFDLGEKAPTIIDLLSSWWKSECPFREVFYRWNYTKKYCGNGHGREFRVAYEEATKLGCKVILGDRPIEVTIRQHLKGLKDVKRSPKERLWKALTCHGPDSLDDDPNSLEAKILEKNLVNFDERDQHMSAALLKVAQEHQSVVAVVGLAHLEGIKEHWRQLPSHLRHLLTFPYQIRGIKATRQGKRIVAEQSNDSLLGVFVKT